MPVTSPHDPVEDFLVRSTAAYRAQLQALLEQGVELGLEPEDAGRRAAASLVVGRRWAEDVGPFYDTDGARAAMGGVTKQAVSDRLHRGALLGLPLASDGSGRTRLVYPVWQFDVLDHLHEVLPAAGYDVERPAACWTVAVWLTTPDPTLEDQTPLTMLRTGATTPVLRLAGEVAASLGTEERAVAGVDAVARAG
ncbi:MAG: hypothetical protein U5L04_11385 [Trueperaceae bacterium]|nr:hypothetical protein [Trueperaceae bacterium]